MVAICKGFTARGALIPIQSFFPLPRCPVCFKKMTRRLNTRWSGHMSNNRKSTSAVFSYCKLFNFTYVMLGVTVLV